MTPVEGYVTTEDGVRLFFQKLGSGSQVVIVPNATYMFDDFKYLASDDRTVVFFDLRNRGRSDTVSEPSKLEGGVLNDVADLEAIRRHFAVGPVDVIGHSYLGMVVVLYAMKYPTHVNRLVQIGPVQPFMDKQYPARLTGADATMAEVSAKLGELQQQGPVGDPKGFGKKMWSLMRELYVADPADAGKIKWSVDHLPNESLFNLMKHYNESLLPSMRRIKLASDDFSKVTMPVLVIHGNRDRHAPYAGGRDWALMLPNARLITIDNAAHLPWIESPETVFGSINTFFSDGWPDAAQQITTLEPDCEV
jgi:proline iminopeptidase